MITILVLLVVVYLVIGYFQYLNVLNYAKNPQQEELVTNFAFYIVCNWIHYIITINRIRDIVEETILQEASTGSGDTYEVDADREIMQLFPTHFPEKHQVAAQLFAEFICDPLRYIEE